ncbi:homeobox-leucine zipper protein ATHB-52-like [Dorcoceras hygrometricum]|uniref:Homeobox-leucine zipper protein n=1 Tax=Dorcoceras hygrometricum TaxID=472368 RepID=A0A2Z7BVW7_9LAMI|nr:homeobox-leucine zipper protein ATHB-52-like [Dorcoceras hygrometricum]
MSLSTSEVPKNNSSKHVKKRLNQDQVQLLESSFDASKKLDPERKFQLARQLGVPPRQIAIWYQNKRARWKNQSLELDYSALEVRLEAALSEKKHLEKQVCGLRGELKRAQEMLSAASRLAQAEVQPQVEKAWIPPLSSLSSCCDEGGGSSSLNDDVFWSGNWAAAGDQADLQYEQLYACLMVNGKGSNEWNHQKDFWV